MGFTKQAQGAALCHYLMYGDNGANRIKFAGVIRKFLDLNPAADDLPKALSKSCEEIEKAVASHMKERVE